ncbi:TIGR03885 family FMN-dependent LLM class oxidoreductase [Flavihumibacter cheonanensis]|uniref:TIGR03557 family F420-dependent LLM class oxidoreductase n=1 Tax=Flavihumibacter cheonanensis TaxID=1442385 RepID=UPI001EF92F39|nr:TIGR03557 family F420-dependent LLM class oxidoreductase [Flavihumibacter cheonanensis]MCG7753850.1 TIGR03557 family F420-dependent LLM class oxidoreductase [Flavihumibacter cheonanensis]
MCLISYHASHEQFGPVELLGYVQQAEAAGFTAIHSSDHFHPWSKRQGESGFTLSWLPVAMQVCRLPFSMVCAPGQRLHPAIVAQALATISLMFPDRLIVELGSGEALNESITGEGWPEKAIRNERLLQCKEVMDALFKGEQVDFNGHIRVRKARLYSRPAIPPPLFCAALSEATAEWAGNWAEGLLTTVDDNLEEAAAKINAFKKQGENKPVHLQLSFCYARSWKEAVEQAYEQWRSNMVGLDKLANLSSTEEFDEAGEEITREDIIENMILITDMKDLKQRIEKIKSLQPARIHLHNISKNQTDYLEDIRSILIH